MADASVHKIVPADAETEAARSAYDIYRGMKTDPRTTPHWGELSNEQRGLLVWVARYTIMSLAK